MSATNTDRTYAEVGREMARWLAEHDPRATPLTDHLNRHGALEGLPAARVEALLGDNLAAFAKGFLAGMAFREEEHGRVRAPEPKG